MLTVSKLWNNCGAPHLLQMVTFMDISAVFKNRFWTFSPEWVGAQKAGVEEQKNWWLSPLH